MRLFLLLLVHFVLVSSLRIGYRLCCCFLSHWPGSIRALNRERLGMFMPSVNSSVIHACLYYSMPKTRGIECLPPWGGRREWTASALLRLLLPDQLRWLSSHFTLKGSNYFGVVCLLLWGSISLGLTSSVLSDSLSVAEPRSGAELQ